MHKNPATYIFILANLVFAGFANQVFAQNGAQISTGLVLAGDVNLSSLSDTAMHQKGYHIGVDARIGPYGFYLSPGLHYYNIELEPTTGFNYLYNKPRFHIIKGPLNLAYKMFITRKFKFRIRGGLDFNYILLIDENNSDISFDNVNDAYFGVNLGAGFDINHFTIDFNYESGLTNYITDDDSSKMGFFTTSIGYFF